MINILNSLSIKQKIFLSFSTIGCLLFAACIFFYYSLNNINSVNQQIRENNIPIEQLTSDLQNYQLIIGKTTASAFNQTDKKVLEASLIQIQEQIKLYETGLTRLKELTGNDQFFSDLLTQADATYKINIKASLSMIEHRQKLLQTKLTLMQVMKQAEDLRFATSDSILNLDSIETNQDDLLEQIIGQGVIIDNLLFTLGSSIKGIEQIASIEKLQQHQEDISMLLKNIDDAFIYISRNAEGLNAGDLLATFNNNLIKVKSTLLEPGVLYQHQGLIINSTSSAFNNYLLFESSSETLLNILLKIKVKASEYFQQAQISINQQINNALTWLWIIAIAFIGFSVLISVSTSRTMLGPLSTINKALDRLALGDLSKDMEKRNNDEFGLLIDNLNKVTSNLRNLLVEINNNIHLLEGLSTESNERSQTLASNTEQQLSQAGIVKNGVHEVHQSSETVVNEAIHSASLVDNAAEQGQQITQISQQTQLSIEHLSERLTDSVQIMADLTDHSNTIEGVLDTIVGVAEQTNLLALNAAIEAARAGEQGRGFAVVADEVRTLASRTQDSTDEINNMINSLQDDTKKAVNAIGKGQKDVNLCVEQSKQLFEAILSVEQNLKEIDNKSEEIQSASENQLQLARNIQDTMDQSEQTAKENYDKTLQAASASESLSELAQALSVEIKRFKL